jgi:L,D-peptidoglycan transpeptidase YkuD (ErfK/YbiS/YcfS/YnhG family)
MLRYTRSSLPPEILNPFRNGGPIRRAGRRLRRWIIVLGAPIALVAVAVTLALAMSEDAPIARKHAARTALQSARDAGALGLAADPLRRAEEAFSAASREISMQLSRMRVNRSFGRAEALLDVAKRRADLAAALSRRQQTESRDRAQRLLARARGGFEQMEWLSSYIPPRSPIRSDVRRAHVSYTEARSLYDAGHFGRAALAAGQANQGLAAAAARFSRLMHSNADPAKSAQYARWVRDTVAWSESTGGKAIIIDKLRRTLTLVSDGDRVRTWRAELGINGTQVKLMSGDRATPEGRYRVTEKRGLRQTRWYKALLLNYPNEEDLARFRAMKRRGQISRRAGPGNLIEIHGEGGRGGDWTDGCVALRNRDMDELFERVGVGTPVTIVGFEVDETTRRAEARQSAARRALTRSGGAAGGLR